VTKAYNQFHLIQKQKNKEDVMASMMDRVVGVLKLDVNTYEEIEADESATTQAAIIVTAVAVLSAIGAFFGARAGNAALEALGDVDIPVTMPVLSPTGLALNALLGAFIAWIVWSALTYFIGTRLFGGQATMGEMLRVIGFAQAPRLLNVLNFIPCLGAIIAIVTWIWALAAGFIGIRQGLDLDNGKTLVTVFLSWLVALLINLFVVAPILALML
jgi:hypothetical protein